MNTISVAAGGSLRTVPAIQAFTARNGMRATIQATTGSRWRHSHASIRKTIASRTSSGRISRRMTRNLGVPGA